MDLKEFLSNKKNLIGLVILILIIIAIPLTVMLVRQQQELRSKAVGGPPITFQGDGVSVVNGEYVTTNPSVQVKLESPLGAPAQ